MSVLEVEMQGEEAMGGADIERWETRKWSTV